VRTGDFEGVGREGERQARADRARDHPVAGSAASALTGRRAPQTGGIERRVEENQSRVQEDQSRPYLISWTSAAASPVVLMDQP
jgi:hypothetical protein